jgi:hypothetical protein
MGIGLGSVTRRILFDGVEAARAAGALVDMDGIHEAGILATRTLDTEWWRQIERTTRDSLRTTLLLWQEQGLGKRGLPDLVDSLQPLFSRERAKRIAQTESTRLFAEGNILAARDDDSVGGMEWQTARDELVCETYKDEPGCGPRNGLIYPKNNLPSMPLHPNCRCAWQPATWSFIRAHPSKWRGGSIPLLQGVV